MKINDNSKKKMRDHFNDRLAGMKIVRQSYEPIWEDCCRLCMPRYPIIYNDPKTNLTTAGNVQRDVLMNGVGIKSLNRLASGIQSSMTNPANRWFRMKNGDPKIDNDYFVQKWLYKAESVMYDVFSKSNFYNATRTFYRDLGGIGTSVTLILPDPEYGINCITLPAGTYYIARDEKGMVSTLYRVFGYSAKQVVDKFGYNNASKEIRNAYDENNFEQYFNIVHAIEPNNFRNSDYFDNINMPFISVYFEGLNVKGDYYNDGFLSVSGYEEQPFFCAVWDLLGDNVYGNSPAMDAYSDLNMIQDLEADTLEALEKQLDPPLKASSDIQAAGVNVFPSGFSYINNENSTLEPLYQVNYDINSVNNKLAEVDLRIKEFFYNDLFNMIQNTTKRMTAYEVSEKMGEKLQMLGSVADRIQYEYLDLVINRVYGILMRNKKPNGEPYFEEAPDLLKGKDLQIEYIGLLTQARKSKDAGNLINFLSLLGNFAGIKPEVLDSFDLDIYLKEIADITGINPKGIVEKLKVEQIRKQRAELQSQQMQNQQDMENIKGAELLSKAKISEGQGQGSNALEELIGYGA